MSKHTYTDQESVSAPKRCLVDYNIHEKITNEKNTNEERKNKQKRTIILTKYSLPIKSDLIGRE